MYKNTKCKSKRYKSTNYKSTAGQLKEDRAFCGILQRERQTAGTTTTKQDEKYKIQKYKFMKIRVKKYNICT